MSNEISINFENAMEQAAYTAEFYLNKSYKILENNEKEFTVSNAIELAKIMCSDFNATVSHIKMQEIRDAIEENKTIIIREED